MVKSMLIGITGGSGSGKTFFQNSLLSNLPHGTASLMSMDNYYLPIDQQSKDANGIENFDLPTAIDRKGFYRDLQTLQNGKSLRIEEYNFNHCDKPTQYIDISAAPIILVEGFFTFYFEEIRELLDLKVFIETPDYLMLKRRILRDSNERGYDLDDVLYRFEHHVTPAFKDYIAPLREEADIIIPNNKHFATAINVVTGFIHHALEK
ncbi:MAG: uridine kinase [Cyclobacteriaceae bacterium]